MAKANADDFEGRRPEDMGDAERADYLEKIDELEREAQAKLHAAPIDSVRRPMDMPDVLREREAAGHSGSARQFKGADSNALAKVWAIGLDFGIMVLAGGLLGWGADYLFGWKPWGILTGLLLGLLVGFTRFVREGLAANRKAISGIKRSPR